MQDFVHLHTHSEYSLLDGAARVKELVETAVEYGMPALAITDHGVLYGVVDFYKQAVQAGLKPIIGCEVYVARRHRMDKVPHVDDSQYHLVLLCENEIGYRNLMQLVSRAFLEGFYYKPRVDRELLQEYSQGLIALSGCIAGEIPELLLAGKYEEACATAEFLREIFGPDNFYLEIQDHGLEEQKKVNQALYQLSRELKIPLVATNDVHYLNRDDAFIHDVLLCIQTGKTISDESRMRFPCPEFYFKSAGEMSQLFDWAPEAVSNTRAIAERCSVELEFGHFNLPDYPLPEGYNDESYLEEMAWRMLPQKISNPGQEVKERLTYELDVINNMGFAGYFLIVQDLVNWARNHDIPVGPGRGSAAGSLVSYVLGITNINPLDYGLLFERFLNPERVSMPDIDVDFCFEKRDQVINYIIDKYGSDRVAQIITFGTMAARAAIRDVGRVLDFPYSEVDRIAKMVPTELGISIDRALQVSSDLIQKYENDYEIRKLVDTARALEGFPRHASVHAAGVVIGRDRLARLVPLQRTSDDHVVTQFAKETVEEIGLLKMDILGLRTLTVIDRALEIIHKTRGAEIDIDDLPLDDPAVYQLLSEGDTIGVFQLESDGLRRLLQEMQPGRFEELIAVIALYRPGPLGSGMVEDFINRKHGRQEIEYMHPLLEPILKETYGVILYQEQVMSIASRLADFTMGEADVLRRAMGKKKPEELMAQRSKFIQGSANHGISKRIASGLFDLMESFAGYGFNKSHSAAYALICYQTAYLKAHYPVEYMCAFLSSVIDNQDRVVFYSQECHRLHIDILPPDINESLENFTVVGDKIRFGLGAIKNVGDSAVRSIIAARQEGKFTSLLDFCRRVDLRQVNKRVVENLILAGAFDSLDLSRREAMAIVNQCLELAASINEVAASNQLTLFGSEVMTVEEPRPPQLGEYDVREKLKMEKEVLGFYVSGNPLEEYREMLPYIITHEITDLDKLKDGTYIRLAGMINGLKRSRTRKGEPWARFNLEGFTGRVEAMVFPATYRRQASHLESDTAVLIEGRVMNREEVPRIAVNHVYQVAEQIEGLHIRLPEDAVDSCSPQELMATLAEYPGDIPVYVRLSMRRGRRMNRQWWVEVNLGLKRRLGAIYGQENVWFQ
ncbi:MAG: DNA polymerase III subunit alpha [Syntrophomonadaceae bacterium]|jgi:DNA polymerase-3 subunit alpha|nr:DNA polymerase III subunit alpha [Syntrophomonadaceae bacterium]